MPLQLSVRQLLGVGRFRELGSHAIHRPLHSAMNFQGCRPALEGRRNVVGQVSRRATPDRIDGSPARQLPPRLIGDAVVGLQVRIK